MILRRVALSLMTRNIQHDTYEMFYRSAANTQGINKGRRENGTIDVLDFNLWL
jgi:hypothetical protein